jgi:hypothetical protein
MVFLRMILGFIVFKEGKLPYPKNIQAIVKHTTTQKSTIDLSIQWDGIFYKCFIKNFVAIMAPIIKLTRKTIFLDKRMSKGLGINQTLIY